MEWYLIHGVLQFSRFNIRETENDEIRDEYS